MGVELSKDEPRHCDPQGRQATACGVDAVEEDFGVIHQATSVPDPQQARIQDSASRAQ